MLDGGIVTAPGTPLVSFMAAVLEALGLRTPDLDYYVGLHAAEHPAAGGALRQAGQRAWMPRERVTAAS